MKENKFIILVVVIVVVCTYFFLAPKKVPEEDVTDKKNTMSLVSIGDCNRNECLYKTRDGYLEGVTTLTGYYKTVNIPKESNDVIEQKAEKCDAFVVADTRVEVKEFLNSYVNYYASSTMTLNIKLMETDQKNMIKNSSIDNLVSIKILIPKITERGMSPCDSIFVVL